MENGAHCTMSNIFMKEVPNNNYLKTLDYFLQEAQFAIVKATLDEIQTSQTNETWIASPRDHQLIEAIFHGADVFIIIFFEEKLQTFLGFAHVNESEICNNVIKLTWMCRKELSFFCAQKVFSSSCKTNFVCPYETILFDNNFYMEKKAASFLCSLFPQDDNFDVESYIKKVQFKKILQNMSGALKKLSEQQKELSDRVDNWTESDITDEALQRSLKKHVTLNKIFKSILTCKSEDVSVIIYDSKKDNYTHITDTQQYSKGDIIEVLLGSVLKKRLGLFHFIPLTYKSFIFDKIKDISRDHKLREVVAAGETVALEFDTNVYRAKLMGICDNSQTLFFSLIDIGEEVVVKMSQTKIYSLLPDLQSLKGLAVCCQIDNPSDQDMEYIIRNKLTEQKLQYLETVMGVVKVNLVTQKNDLDQQIEVNKIVVMDSQHKDLEDFGNAKSSLGSVQEVKSDKGSTSNLSDVSSEVSAYHLQEFIKPENRLRLPEVTETISVEATHVISGNQFYGHILDYDSKYFFEMIDRMNVPTERNTVPNEVLVPGLIVIAPFLNGWYRSLVKRITEDDRVEVFFVDFGNSSIVERCYIKKYDTSFNNVPFYAVLFKIGNAKLIKDSAQKALREMSRILLNNTISCLIHKVNNSKLLVTASDPNGNDLGISFANADLMDLVDVN